MSDMGFGYYGAPDGEGAPNTPESGQNGPKWFRDKMEADSKVLAEMKAELDRLRAERRQDQVRQAFEAKGFNPGAAALYQGEPDKVDDWLATNASYLAKSEDAPMGGAPAGPPATTVSANSQAQMAAMGSIGGEGSQQVLSTDDDIAAKLAATRTPEEFQEVARSLGWNYDMLA